MADIVGPAPTRLGSDTRHVGALLTVIRSASPDLACCLKAIFPEGRDEPC